MTEQDLTDRNAEAEEPRAVKVTRQAIAAYRARQAARPPEEIERERRDAERMRAELGARADRRRQRGYLQLDSFNPANRPDPNCHLGFT